MRVRSTYSHDLIGGAVARLIVAENNFCFPAQLRDAPHGSFHISFFVFARNDYRDGQIFLRNGGGNSLATTTSVMQSLFNKGRRAQNRFRKVDNNGTYLGNSTILCVSSASKPASFIRFRMSDVASQFCSTRGTFIPSHSAKVTSGSHRWLYVVTSNRVRRRQSGFRF